MRAALGPIQTTPRKTSLAPLERLNFQAKFPQPLFSSGCHSIIAVTLDDDQVLFLHGFGQSHAHATGQMIVTTPGH